MEGSTSDKAAFLCISSSHLDVALCGLRYIPMTAYRDKIQMTEKISTVVNSLCYISFNRLLFILLFILLFYIW